VIAFGLGHPGQNEEDVNRFLDAYLSRGWNTFQICSETEWWDEGSDEYPRKPRDVERLRWTLDLVARKPGAQVALVGICTLKRQVSLEEQFRWAFNVACVAAGGDVVSDGRGCTPGQRPRYKNVAIFTHNEFDNCAGRDDWGGNARNCAGKEEVKRHVRMYREAGFEVVTADDSFTLDPRRTRGMPESQIYGFRLANAGARPASFHPDRELRDQPWDPMREAPSIPELYVRDPIGSLGLDEGHDLDVLEKLARYNGGEFILSETVAWADDTGRCDGLSTCDPERIPRLIERCSRVAGCFVTIHSRNQLAGRPATVIPEAR